MLNASAGIISYLSVDGAAVISVSEVLLVIHLEYLACIYEMLSPLIFDGVSIYVKELGSD